MIPVSFFNTLSKKQEVFDPLRVGHVGMYTCGPTVYHYVTIGNWRTYTLGDLVHRTLRYNGYKVLYIMNITDVGHLTGDNEGDASQGEDRMEKAKKREGKNAWEIAQFYTDDFIQGLQQLNILPANKLTKATDHIREQIALVEQLEKNNLTYQISDGIYFDVTAYELSGKKYGELSTIDQTSREFARIEPNPEKKDPRDFALWKFSSENEKRDMEWESPWGVGFPGWHIECSAMSMKYLGPQFDIHIGGEDLRQTHHPNEIAQSEGATGCAPFVHYWMHGAFLLVDGGRMGKSLGNAYTLQDITERGFSPRALRYFYLSGHYRHQLNFTWDALQAAQNAFEKLQNKVIELRSSAGWKRMFSNINKTYKAKFLHALNSDLEMPRALAVIWELIKDESVSPAAKYKTLLDFDKVLGLGLADIATNSSKTFSIPGEVQALLDERTEARRNKDWKKSDELRAELSRLGYGVEDTPQETRIFPL